MTHKQNCQNALEQAYAVYTKINQEDDINFYPRLLYIAILCVEALCSAIMHREVEE